MTSLMMLRSVRPVPRFGLLSCIVHRSPPLPTMHPLKSLPSQPVRCFVRRQEFGHKKLNGPEDRTTVYDYILGGIMAFCGLYLAFDFHYIFVHYAPVSVVLSFNSWWDRSVAKFRRAIGLTDGYTPIYDEGKKR